METIANNGEKVSIPRAMTFDLSANNSVVDTHIESEQKKNARGPMQTAHARKAQFLIVDEEWW